MRRRCCLLAETVAAWSDADCRAWCLGIGMKLHRSAARGGGEAADADYDADVVVGFVEARDTTMMIRCHGGERRSSCPFDCAACVSMITRSENPGALFLLTVLSVE